MVALFYLILGVVTYGGACASIKNPESSDFFRQPDTMIDLNRYLPADEGYTPKLRISNAIETCRSNENIFQVLRANSLFDISDLSRIDLFAGSIDKFNPLLDTDFSKLFLLTDAEKTSIENARLGNLSTYHSSLFTANLCTSYFRSTLPKFAGALEKAARQYYIVPYIKNKIVGHSLKTAANLAYALNKAFVQYRQQNIDEINKILKKIDQIILYEEHDFNNTILILMRTIIKSEKFLQTKGMHFVNKLAKNLTLELIDMMTHFISKVINECNDEVGKCKPLANIYYQGVYYICERLVDPIVSRILWHVLCLVFHFKLVYHVYYIYKDERRTITKCFGRKFVFYIYEFFHLLNT